MAHGHEGHGELALVEIHQFVVDRQLRPDGLREMSAHLLVQAVAQDPVFPDQLRGPAIGVRDVAVRVCHDQTVADRVERRTKDRVPVPVAFNGGDKVARVYDRRHDLILAGLDAVIMQTEGPRAGAGVVSADYRLESGVADLDHDVVDILPAVDVIVMDLCADGALQFLCHLDHSRISDDGELAPVCVRLREQGRDVVPGEGDRHHGDADVRRPDRARVPAAGDQHAAALFLEFHGEPLALLIGVRDDDRDVRPRILDRGGGHHPHVLAVGKQNDIAHR